MSNFLESSKRVQGQTKPSSADFKEATKKKLDKGKRPFVAFVMGGLLKHYIDSSFEEQESQEESVKPNRDRE
jgi:hypothetical protein